MTVVPFGSSVKKASSIRADSPSARGEPRMASTRSAEEGAFFAIVADKHITAFPEGMGEIRFRMGDAPGIGASVTFPGGDGVQVLDIPLQHCSDRILTAMCRRGSKAEIVALLDKIRQKMPNAVFRTSLITGLPGETEAEFEELCDFLREENLVRAGVFQYSPEEGTPAASMPDQVEPDVAAHRLELLVELQSRVMDAYHESRLGETVEVLCEGFDDEMGCFVGRTYADSPDIDGHVYFTAAGDLPAGTFVPVRLTDVADGDMMGEIDDTEAGESF